ncbi:lysozyme-like isoform X3 [Pectinophora gossypiella]|uniref:lysozyme-like isoform X3 n=1 Tax=Pectinophora gossypiella TaxID=13191 RepID=UPI00214E062D|nr:lysozyme-like isoform X3 [Pectinophora gossypiella]XP_049868494.1 lysozyme-like isoform X3 [Pectinophora gossypiella]
MQKYTLAVLVLAIVLQCEAYQMSYCELIEELRMQRFPEDKMRDWVCLVQSESSRRTHAISRRNSDGSREYGLFQISDKYWCSKTSTPGKDCNVTCADLLMNDITESAKCAKKVYKRQGFRAWYGWRAHCQKYLPPLLPC